MERTGEPLRVRSTGPRPTFDKSLAVKNPRVNGQLGMEDPDFNVATWELDLRGNGKRISLKMEDIKKLSAIDMTTEFKCIEGWSEMIHWTGPRLSELLEKYGVLSADDRAHGYVAISTPDEEYYVGLDGVGAPSADLAGLRHERSTPHT